MSLKAVDIWWAKWRVGGREELVMQPRGKAVGVHQVLGEAVQATVQQTVLDGEILFADLVGTRSDQVTGRTWGEKGRMPVVRRTGNRFSVNAMQTRHWKC
ncbi:hypothetical protein [Streptomyces roseicoloratus]|uniref:hypothetical protein n=1 Tax=Streptomyces roseicoloratus TaxID=2508722 RepID=UPI003CCC5C08